MLPDRLSRLGRLGAVAAGWQAGLILRKQNEFAYGPFLGIERTDDLVQIQVFWAAGKAVDAKLAMYKRIVERLAISPGVRPEDVLISVVESAAENWSFGAGETQFYKLTDHDGGDGWRGATRPVRPAAARRTRCTR